MDYKSAVSALQATNTHSGLFIYVYLFRYGKQFLPKKPQTHYNSCLIIGTPNLGEWLIYQLV